MSDYWSDKRAAFQQHFEQDDITQFLSWSSTVATMFVRPIFWIEHERDMLEFNGYPSSFIEYNGYPDSNLVHQAYHLMKWEQTTGLRVRELHSIVEVGGGYGALARIARIFGFTGTYTIYDFPELVRLQQFYLKEAQVAAEFRTHLDGPVEADLFVGLFSLSEMTAQVQDVYLDNVCAPHFLFAMYDALWEGQESVPRLIAYAQERKGARVEIPHIGGRFYLLG